MPRTAPSPTANGRRRPAARTDPDALLAATGASPFLTADQVHTPVRKAKAVYVPFVCDLGDTTVATAVESATTFVTGLGLYPRKDKKLFKTYAEIARWCTEHQISTLAEVVDEVAAQLVADLAGLPDLDFRIDLGSGRSRGGSGAQARAAAARDRQRAHRVRNALVSLRSATVLTRTRTRKERLVEDTLAYGLPALPGLEDRRSRPLTDEEILLCRFLVEIDRAEGALPRPLLAYLVGENGVRSIESTALDTDNLDSREQPTRIRAAGAWDFGKRKVPLTDYAAATMPLLLAQLRPGTQPLTYTGDQPGTGASTASLSGVIDRHLHRAGVLDAEATAKSLSLWRVQHALMTTGDMRQARRYHGGATRNVLEDLKLDFDESDIANGVVHLHRRDTQQHTASVSVSDFYDDSVTLRGKTARAKHRRKATKGRG